MVKTDVRTILSGRYAGCEIKKDPVRNIAYIEVDEGVNIIRQNVECVEVINSTTGSNQVEIIKGALLAGGVGALAGSASKTEILIMIHWVDGESSIAKVDNYIFEPITVGMHTQLTEEEANALNTERKRAIEKKQVEDAKSTMWMWIIGIAWFVLVYLCGEM